MAEIRYNPITRDWVMVASHRQNRPQMPKNWCPFCPGSGKVPEEGFDVLRYMNDFPALKQDHPVPDDVATELFRTAPAYGRCAVWDPEADVNFAQIDALIKSEKEGVSEALREGSIGRVFGMDNYMSQAVCKHTVGTAISGTNNLLTDGAARAGDAYIHIDGASDGQTIRKGDVLTIGNVNYAVAKDVTFTGGEGDVYVVGGVKQEIADNTAVKGLTCEGGIYTNNLAFHPMAFAYVTRPLINPDGQGVASYVTSFNGISLRVTKGYDQQFKRSIYSMDVLYGFKTLYPDLAVRALG